MSGRIASESSVPSDEERDLEGAIALDVTRFRDRSVHTTRDIVAREEPLEIQLGGASLAVVMRTPGFDADLALGFLVTERVIASRGEVASIRHCDSVQRPEAEGNVIRVVLRPGVRVDLESLRRNFFANSSCGICGRATIESALAEVSPLADATRIPAHVLSGMLRALESTQELFSHTGGLHGVGLFDASGRLLVTREDVGRHNAADKVIGWALRQGRTPLAGHSLVVSGRSSFEIVQKAAVAGISIVAAVSAPTSLAVDFARSAGMTLLGFVRGGDFNVYSGGERIVWPKSCAGGSRDEAAG